MLFNLKFLGMGFRSLLWLSPLVLSSCSGGGGVSPAVPTVAPPAPSQNAFAQIDAEVAAFQVESMALVIGDETGVRHIYEKGNFTTSSAVQIASATKLVTGLAVWSLIEDGTLSEQNRPGQFIPFWTDIAGDNRALVTLRDLMAFTSGFEERPSQQGCTGSPSYTLSACVTEIYEDGLNAPPGQRFAYGPEHMQIAALMVHQAVGDELQTIMQDRLFVPAGLSGATEFPAAANDNPKYAGGLRSSAEDFGALLTMLLSGGYTNDLDSFLADRTANLAFEYRPPAAAASDAEWHYGFGFWIECDRAVFASECAINPTISSPGGFGFLPWVDFEHEYWAIIAMEERITSTFRPSEAAVELEQILQPLIEQALNAE